MARTEAKPNIFDLLSAQESLIEERLAKFINNYPNYTNEQALDEIKLIFDTIKSHFDRQDALLKMVIVDEAFERTVQDYIRNKTAINEHIIHMTQLHVDEPGFKAYLKDLAFKIHDLAKLEDTRLHLKLKERISPEELEEANEELTRGMSF